VGSCAWNAYAQVNEFYAGLREPEGRFHFAGDAVGGVPGYSHAAFHSGRQAAADVLARG
jgi:monoamine oxidase